MAAGDQLWQQGISYGSRGSVMAAINGPGGQIWQPQVIQPDQLLGGWWVIARLARPLQDVYINGAIFWVWEHCLNTVFKRK